MALQLEQTVSDLAEQLGISLTKQEQKPLRHYTKGQNADYQLEHILYGDKNINPTVKVETIIVKKGTDTWTAMIQDYGAYSVHTLRYEGNRADAEQNKQKVKQMMPTMSRELFPFATELLKSLHLVTDPDFLKREQQLRVNLPSNDYVKAESEVSLEAFRQMPKIMSIFYSLSPNSL